MLGFDLHAWEAFMVLSLWVAAFAAVAVGIATSVVVHLTREDTRGKSEEFARYKADSEVKTSEASSKAAHANERAAELELHAAKLAKEAELAKVESARLGKQLLDMNRMRRLEKSQADVLRTLLLSDGFQTEPKIALMVGSVADAEAQMFAMELQKFFESCGVNIYPTNGGFPNEVVQLAPSANGLVMTVKDKSKPVIAFVAFQRLMNSIGLVFDVEQDPTRRENEAMLSVLRKQLL